MWRLLRFLFLGDGHLHDWETINTTMVTRVFNGGWSERESVQYTLRCKHCGNIKFVEDD